MKNFLKLLKKPINFLAVKLKKENKFTYGRWKIFVLFLIYAWYFILKISEGGMEGFCSFFKLEIR